MCDSECAVSSATGAANGTNGGTPTTNGLLVEAINPAIHMASSLSAPSMQQQIQLQQQQQQQKQQNEFLSAQDLAMENHWLREKLKEVTSDRDRLLCEVANLRLELDMAELKRLPEDRWVISYKVVKQSLFEWFKEICYHISQTQY